MEGKTTQKRGMEEAPENGKELPHSAHANGMNELVVNRAESADSFSAWNKVLPCVYLSTSLLQVPASTYKFGVHRKQHT